MTKQEARERILRTGIVPVVRASSAKQAIMAVDAVCLGGIPIAEITMTVPGAIAVIRELVRNFGTRVLVGAGTVLNAAIAQECLDAGAQFLVSPGLLAPVIDLARSNQTLVMAGALTPTEVITAWKAGADFVKVFPCGAVGGPEYIKALRGPLPDVPFVPTGGVSLHNAADFVRAGAAALGVGGELVQSRALAASRFDIVADNARKFVQAISEALAQAQQQHLETASAARLGKVGC